MAQAGCPISRGSRAAAIAATLASAEPGAGVRSAPRATQSGVLLRGSTRQQRILALLPGTTCGLRSAVEQPCTQALEHREHAPSFRQPHLLTSENRGPHVNHTMHETTRPGTNVTPQRSMRGSTCVNAARIVEGVKGSPLMGTRLGTERSETAWIVGEGRDARDATRRADQHGNDRATHLKPQRGTS
jgi:hypothetical protein